MSSSEVAIMSHYGRGGSLLYLQQLVRAFERRNFRPLYYLPKDTPVEVKDRALLRFVLKEPSAHPEYLRLRVFKYPYHLLKYLYNAFSLRFESSVKVVHILFPFYLSDTILLERLRRSGMRVVLTVHEVFPHRAFLGGALDCRLQKALFQRADILCVHTEGLKRQLLSLYDLREEGVEVVPHGIFDIPSTSLSREEIRKMYGIPSGRRVLLFFGTIRQNKGLEDLLEAMRSLKGEGFFLLVAGRPAGVSEPPERYYSGLIHQKGIEDAVLWLNRYIEGDEVARVFRVADAVVLPYRSEFCAQSGVLSLAMGSGRPCVVTDTGGLAETVRRYNTGVVVEPGSPEALAEGIRRLFQVHIGPEGFTRYREKNSWDAVAERLKGLYRRLLY